MSPERGVLACGKDPQASAEPDFKGRPRMESDIKDPSVRAGFLVADHLSAEKAPRAATP
jgi:hypothetical protein